MDSLLFYILRSVFWLAGQLRQEIKSIDIKVTTTSMKLAEEKALIRRKENLRARLRGLTRYENYFKDYQALRVRLVPRGPSFAR